MSNPVYQALKKALILSPLAIPIGIVLSYGILVIFVGDTGGAFALMAFSIICTAGISLIVWVPIWYGLGYLVLLLVQMLLKAVGVDVPAMFTRSEKSDAPSTELQSTSKSPDTKETDSSNLTKDQVALMNYIRKAKQKGLSNDAITRNLGQNGWNIDSISQALRLVEQG